MMVKKNVKRGLIIAGAIVGVILIISISYLAYFLSENSAYKVASGAMEPILKVNDRVIVDKTVPFDILEIDDIIVFLRPSGHDRTIIMRIVDITSNSEGEKIIRTKGDANVASIPGTDFPITEKEYIGRVSEILRP
jgi:signal peptidase